VRSRYRLRWGAPVAATLAVLLGAAVLVAGCGGSGLVVASISSSSASGKQLRVARSDGVGLRIFGPVPSPAQQTQAEATELKFARCMRANGVPGFPDPRPPSAGGAGFALGGPGLDYAAPLFRRAQRTCISVFRRQRRGGG
jgi:hypothetical protein